MTEPSDEEFAKLQQAFDSCDLNGDGLINTEEFHALLIMLDGDISREECLLDFDAADTAEDGYLDFKEFIAWWTH
jgi:Ca2+-binding EF-hand superfamily protein